MEEYYIRTPDHDDSRGPFDVDKLQTLATAGQIDKNTIYYDQEKEEWLPIGLNEALTAAIFPTKKSLNLRIGGKPPTLPPSGEPPAEKPDDGGVDLNMILAAADGTTAETKGVKAQRESVERAAMTAPGGLALIFLLSTVFLLYPLLPALTSAFSDRAFLDLVSYPIALLGIVDLTLALALGLGVTEVYSYARGRAMLTLGFGLYLGWALQAPEMILVFALAGIGTFAATLAKRYALLILTLVLGATGHAALVYFSVMGRFGGFFEVLRIPLGE